MPQTTRLFTLVQNFMEWEFTTRRKILWQCSALWNT
jgi:hypothetical protein